MQLCGGERAEIGDGNRVQQLKYWCRCACCQLTLGLGQDALELTLPLCKGQLAGGVGANHFGLLLTR